MPFLRPSQKDRRGLWQPPRGALPSCLFYVAINAAAVAAVSCSSMRSGALFLPTLHALSLLRCLRPHSPVKGLLLSL